MTADSVPFLLDSNILVYALDTTEGRKHILANALLQKCFQGTAHYAVSLQNISEFFYVITEKISHPLTPDAAKDFAKKMVEFRGFKVLVPSPQTILAGMELKEKHGAHFWDALLGAVMKEHGITTLYTEDTKDFGKIPGITPIKPFTEKKKLNGNGGEL